jgi:hypothetical protein
VIRELWPTPPGRFTELGVPDFKRWGDAAPLVASSEHLHRLMCTLSLDVDAVGLASGDPAVVNSVVTRLAGTGLIIADIVRSLSMTLDSTHIDPGHTVEVLEKFSTARQTFVDASGAAQAAAEALRNYTQRQSTPAGSPGDKPPLHSRSV